MELVEILEAVNEQLPWKSETDKTALSEKIKALDPNYVKPEEPAADPTTETPTVPEPEPEAIVNSSSSQIGDATGAGATGENEEQTTSVNPTESGGSAESGTESETGIQNTSTEAITTSTGNAEGTLEGE